MHGLTCTCGLCLCAGAAMASRQDHISMLKESFKESRSRLARLTAQLDGCTDPEQAAILQQRAENARQNIALYSSLMNEAETGKCRHQITSYAMLCYSLLTHHSCALCYSPAQWCPAEPVHGSKLTDNIQGSSIWPFLATPGSAQCRIFPSTPL